MKRILTGRNPDDIPAFTTTLISALGMAKVTENT